VLERYPQEVKIVVKHYPLGNHKFAFPAAMGAMAAKNQGKFWEFHATPLKNHNALNAEKILSIARELGLDMARYAGDSKSPASRAFILEDISDARRVGVRGTPSVFINGKVVKNRSLGALLKLIAAELEKVKQ